MRKSRQKIKKKGCLRVSQGKNEKNGLAGKIAGPKMKKWGCWKNSKAKNEKNGLAGKIAGPKMKKMGLLEK